MDAASRDLELCDRRRADCMRSWGSAAHLATGGCHRRGHHDQPLCAVVLGPLAPDGAENTPGMDCVLDQLGNCSGGVGCCFADQTAHVTADCRLDRLTCYATTAAGVRLHAYSGNLFASSATSPRIRSSAA